MTMPESGTALLAAQFLNFTHEPLTNKEWIDALHVHQAIPFLRSDQLVVMLFVNFPFRHHPTQLKQLYRQLFFVAHVLKEWQKYGSVNELTIAFLCLVQKYHGNYAPEVMLRSVTSDTDQVQIEIFKQWNLIFAIVFELFNVSKMYSVEEQEITLEKAILTNLIHPPKLSCISPLLSEFFGQPL